MEYSEDITLGTTIKYKWKDIDYRGLKVDKPYIAISINGSDWVDSDVIMETKSRIESGEMVMKRD